MEPVYHFFLPGILSQIGLIKPSLGVFLERSISLKLNGPELNEIKQDLQTEGNNDKIEKIQNDGEEVVDPGGLELKMVVDGNDGVGADDYNFYYCQLLQPFVSFYDWLP